MNGYLGMDAPRFVTLVSARRWLVVVIVVAAVALASAASLTQSKQYRAGADLLFGPTTSPGEIFPGDAADTGGGPDRVAATNLALASLDTVAARVKRRFPAGPSIEQLRAAVSTKAQGESDVVTVTARAASPRQAAALANTFATEIIALRRDTARADVQRAIDAIQAAVAAGTAGGRRPDARVRTLQRRLAELQVVKGLQTGDIRLVERATVPRHASSPNFKRNLLVAVLVALILGLLLITVLSGSEDRVRDEEELAVMMGAPILARVPRASRFRRPTDVWRPGQDPAFLEAFEFLRHGVERLRHDDRGTVVAVTSPTAADGKSTVTAWLTRSLAAAWAEVVALDLDMSGPGLSSYLSGRGDADRDPRAAPGGKAAPASGVRLLTARNDLDMEVGLVTTARLRHVFANLREQVDFVLVDTAPLSLVADATAVAATADGVLLVVDVARVRRRDMLAAKRQLAHPGVNLLGLVVNRAARSHAPLPQEFLELEHASADRGTASAESAYA